MKPTVIKKGIDGVKKSQASLIITGDGKLLFNAICGEEIISGPLNEKALILFCEGIVLSVENYSMIVKIVQELSEKVPASV